MSPLTKHETELIHLAIALAGFLDAQPRALDNQPSLPTIGQCKPLLTLSPHRNEHPPVETLRRSIGKIRHEVASRN
jgi:hypothetical protein